MGHELMEMTRDATAIVVPVLPSDIDIHAAARCIGELLVRAKVRAPESRIAVIANRVRSRTLIYRALTRFLGTLQIPFVASLRDVSAYLRAAERGTGIFEMPEKQTRLDRAQWAPLISWLESRPDHGQWYCGPQAIRPLAS
jgi:chromosome partitioning protein